MSGLFYAGAGLCLYSVICGQFAYKQASLRLWNLAAGVFYIFLCVYGAMHL